MQIEINRITGCFVPLERRGVDAGSGAVFAYMKKIRVEFFMSWFVI